MKINKIFTTIILIALLSVKANAFMLTTLFLISELLLTDATSVAIVGEAIEAGEAATAIIRTTASTAKSLGRKKIVTKTIKK